MNTPITMDERTDTERSLSILRLKLAQERDLRQVWKQYALTLEQLMRREGWSEESLNQQRPCQIQN